MARISTRKFTVEDFKDEQSWIGKLLQPLNDFFGQMTTAFSNGLTVQDNLHQEIREVKFLNNTTNYPITFKAKFNVYPKGMYIISCVDSANEDLTECPFINWSYGNGIVTIRSITGLTLDHTYAIKILIIYS